MAKHAPTGACEFCGATDDLVWDHIDPATKEFNVMSRLTFAPARIEAEIAKCRILCRSCNSAGRRNGRHSHGKHVGRTARYRQRDLDRAAKLRADYLASQPA